MKWRITKGPWEAKVYQQGDMVLWYDTGIIYAYTALTATTAGQMPGEAAVWVQQPIGPSHKHWDDDANLWDTFDIIEGYTGAPILDVVGTRQISFTWGAHNIHPISFAFDIVSGDLVAKYNLEAVFNFSFIWSAAIGNNQDAGIRFDVVLRSGTGIVPVDDTYANLFQSSREMTQAFGASTRQAFAILDPGDRIGIDASEINGQTGLTSLEQFHLYLDVRPLVTGS